LRIANALMFVGSCFLVAQGVNQVSEAALAPVTTGATRAPEPIEIEQRSWSDRKAILDRNLFNVQVAGGEPIEEPEQIVELTPTKLPLKLLGTIASEDQLIASASIENTRDRSHESVRVGDQLKSFSEVQVERVGRGHVVLLNGAKREVLKLSEDLDVPSVASRAPRRSARSSRRPRSERDPQDRLRDLAKTRGAAAIFSQARILPRYEDGQMVGIQVSKIEPGSLFEDVGLQDGDTITAVNGEPLDNPAASKNLLDALRRGESIIGSVEGSDGSSRDIEITAEKFLETMDDLESEG
jgi:general secretion pathway protein C